MGHGVNATQPCRDLVTGAGGLSKGVFFLSNFTMGRIQGVGGALRYTRRPYSYQACYSVVKAESTPRTGSYLLKRQGVDRATYIEAGVACVEEHKPTLLGRATPASPLSSSKSSEWRLPLFAHCCSSTVCALAFSTGGLPWPPPPERRAPQRPRSPSEEPGRTLGMVGCRGTAVGAIAQVEC